MQRQTLTPRLNPSCMIRARASNISTKLPNNSDLVAKIQNTARQSAPSMASSQGQHAISSQGNLPRSVSVNRYADSSQEVTVESSVTVSHTFKRDAAEAKNVVHKLEEIQAPRYQLVCCTCMMYKPGMMLGECGCLACMDCLETMTRPRYCNNCQVDARLHHSRKVHYGFRQGVLWEDFHGRL